MIDRFKFYPVTPGRLADLEEFSCAHGKYRYCSCMRWRLKSSVFSKATKAERIAMLERRIYDGIPSGVLAYANNVPIGWCSVGPA